MKVEYLRTCSAVSTTGASEGAGGLFNPGMVPPNRNNLSMFNNLSGNKIN